LGKKNVPQPRIAHIRQFTDFRHRGFAVLVGTATHKKAHSWRTTMYHPRFSQPLLSILPYVRGLIGARTPKREPLWCNFTETAQPKRDGSFGTCVPLFFLHRKKNSPPLMRGDRSGDQNYIGQNRERMLATRTTQPSCWYRIRLYHLQRNLELRAVIRITEHSHLAIHVHTTGAVKPFFRNRSRFLAFLPHPLLEKKRPPACIATPAPYSTRPAPCTKCCAQRKRVASLQSLDGNLQAVRPPSHLLRSLFARIPVRSSHQPKKRERIALNAALLLRCAHTTLRIQGK